MEQVVLVNELDEQIGVMEKMEAHEKALLHRAISVFIFNSKGEMLLQKRAAKKYHSAGLWTNACCSHPRPAETAAEAAHRRLKEELGFETPLRKAFDFTYKAPFDNGLTEHEFDHVFTGIYEGRIYPEADEVQDYCFKPMEEIENALELKNDHFTIWFKIAYPLVREWRLNQQLISK